MKKALSILLSISLGVIFIVSAASKIYPMEPFEYQFVDMGLATWKTSPYIARLFISMEFFLGMLLVLNIALRKITVKFAIGLLLIFSVYLVYKIVTEGNTGNCGCFGELVVMSPLQGILKNVFLLVCFFVLYLLTGKDYWNSKWKLIVSPVLLIGSLCLGFLIYPVNPTFSSTLDKEKVNYKLPLELMYLPSKIEKPKIDLTKGKHIIAFMSLSCPHCRIAGKKLAIIHKKNPSLPVYLALNGDKKLEKTFFEDTHTQNIPHHLFLGPLEWIKVAGISLPVIMYVDNSIVKKKFNGITMSQEDMEKWMAE